jgi:hypothetical protein
MRDVQKIVVDEIEYSVTYFSGTKSLGVLTDLLKLAGEPIAQLLSGEGSVLDLDLGKVLPLAMRALTQNMNRATTIELVKEVLSSCSKGASPLSETFDLTFAGRPGHMINVLAAVLKVQYGDLKNVKGLIGVLRPMGPQE